MTKDMHTNVNYPVIMHNDLIKSKSNLSLNEIKVLRLAIMQVVKEDTDLQTYQIRIVDLAKILKIDDSNLYKDIHDICKHLLQEIVYIGDGNPKHKWQMFQWCSSCRYNDGIITIKLHDDLKPYLLNLSKYYTQYLLEDIILLKSVYSIRVYELIREQMRNQKVYADKDVTVYLSIDTIKQATNTEGKYSKINSFVDKVIKKATDEINDKLQYYITYTPVKEGRRFVGFKFNIMSKAYARILAARKGAKDE